MNFLECLNTAQMECDIAGAPATDVISSVIGTTGDLARLANWVNVAWNDIQIAHTDWGWMRKTATFPTIGVSNPLYTLSQIGITGEFGAWQRETFRNYVNPAVVVSIGTPAIVTLQNHGLNAGDQINFFTTGTLPTGLFLNTTYYVKTILDANNFTFSATSGGAEINTSGSADPGITTITSNNMTSFVGFLTEVFMEYMDYDEWRNGYLYGALRTSVSRPLVVTIDPSKSIGCGPISDKGYTIVGDYFAGPTPLVNATDIPSLPLQYHYAIVYKVMMYYGAFIGAPEVYNRGEEEFGKMMKRLDSNRLPDCLLNGAIA